MGRKKITRNMSTKASREFWEKTPTAETIKDWPDWKRAGIVAAYDCDGNETAAMKSSRRRRAQDSEKAGITTGMSLHAETITGPQPSPTLHETFMVGQRVRLRGFSPELDGREGTIVGIGTTHLAFSYIVKTDEPVPAPKEHPGDPWECVLIPGGCLEKLS